jgi:hypothetical protein
VGLFFWRTSKKAGPLRLTASRSGLTTSLGGKSLRLGAGPRGASLRASRGGLVYRNGLSHRR